MPAAPLPPDEEARLQALAQYELFDTAPEPSFDRVTGFAARIFNVPVSLISLVGRERQWLKSHHGVDVCETSRDTSFCAHAIILPPEAGVFVVPDATRDPRFVDNPLVTGPLGVRFYAGAPLRTPAGLTVGSLCVLDTRPREFSEQDRATLADLAASVVELLELRLATLRQEQESAERRWVEVALRQSENRFRHMAANTPGMVYQLVRSADGSFHFPFVSDGCREFYGLDPQGIYDRPECIFEPIEPSDRASYLAEIGRSAEMLSPLQWEGRLIGPDGTVRWVESKSRPEVLGAGKILWCGVLFDITERKRAQIELENSHRLMGAIINGTDNHIFIKDVAGRYLLMNPAGAALLNTTPEEAAGKDDSAFFPPESVGSNRASDEAVMRTGDSCTYESSDIIDGVEHVFLSTKSPYRDADGNLLGIIGIVREITEQRRAAEALRAAKEEAEKANRAKSEFLSRMSHELRTPLNAILGFGQLLEMGDLYRREAESIGHIMKAGRHLLGLIDEVLAISRIEAGRMNLSLEPVAVAEMTQECLSLVVRQAAERGIVCENRCADADPGGAARYVQADRQRLRQVLLNLLSNAVKYNRLNGRVTMTCQRRPGLPGDPERLRLEVTDTGTGLDALEIAKLFTPFERLSAERSLTEGTGLGLALSKGLIEVMNGTIGVESVSGEGSTFWLELPLAADPLAGLIRGGSSPAKPCEGENCEGTILYIEDNLSNLRLIEILLEAHPGVTLLSAQQGSLGLEMARASRPDLILLDLHLPDIPGWEVLKSLRADPATSDIPVIVVSADATAPQIDRLMQAGALDYLTKPINVLALMQILARHLKPATFALDEIPRPVLAGDARGPGGEDDALPPGFFALNFEPWHDI